MKFRFNVLLLAACVSSLSFPFNVLAQGSGAKDRTIKKSISPAQTISSSSEQALIRAVESDKEDLPIDLDVPGQAFVSTGPYVGVPIQYAGEDLIINSPSVNTDLQLLKIRKEIDMKINALIHGNITNLPNHSHLILSGITEVQAGINKQQHLSERSDINLTNVSLDAFFIGPSRWTQGFVEFSFENGLPFNNQFRVANSNLFVNKAFITIGDLMQSPVYGTFGQYYVPFGKYSSIMVNDPLTKSLGRTKARAITVGYFCQGLHTTGFVFKGDSFTSDNSHINNGGFSANYAFKGDHFSAEIGGSMIANLADSLGMQAGANFQFYERIAHRVPAYSLRGALHLGSQIDLIGEVVSATRSFNVNDLSFDHKGARPMAADFLGAYSFKIGDRPSSFGLAYGLSKDSLALGIPKARYGAVFNTSLWRNTLQSLEFKHDVAYGASRTANGPVGAATTAGACTASLCSGMKNENTVTFQFDYYF